MPRSCRSRSTDLALALLLACPSTALAGSCCAGPTTSIPSRLARDERVAAGSLLSASGAVARWTTDGVTSTRSGDDVRLELDVFAGWRWDAHGQVAVSAPVVLQHVGGWDGGAWGFGAGDVRVTALWEPGTELRRVGGRPGAPVTMLAAGLRVPTGRSWDDAKSPMKADALGEGDAAITLTAQVERTVDRVPWSVSLATEVGLGALGPRPAIDVAAGVGRSFDARWSTYATLSHRERFFGEGRTARTTAGLRVQRALLGVGRVWAAVTGDLPIPGIGAELPVEVRGTVGFAWTR